MRTSNDPSGASKKAKSIKMGDFKRRMQSWRTFFKVIRETQVVLDFSHVWVHIEPVRDKEYFKGAVRNVKTAKKDQNGKRWSF